MIVGGVLLVVSLWLALWFLPRNAPLSATEEQRLMETDGVAAVNRARDARLSEEVHLGGWVSVLAFAITGFSLIATGAFYRSQVDVVCRSCQRPVTAWKGPIGLQCPLGEHYAAMSWVVLVVTIGFWASALIGGVVALAMLG